MLHDTLLVEEKLPLKAIASSDEQEVDYTMEILNGWKKKRARLKIRLHLFMLALKNYRSVNKAYKVLQQLYTFKNTLLGGSDTKIVQVNGKYYHDIYAPGFPCGAFNDYIEAEFNRIVPITKKTNPLTFIFFAITKKCPLQCEHCFEWDNLNKKESLTLHDLKAVTKKFQEDGLAQIHFSGGEPMVRIKDLVELVDSADKKSEFYVLTSGYNFTEANAKALKNAGVTGVVISLDHFDAEKHNAFRGFKDCYNDVLKAIKNAQQQNFVVAVSICVTKSFITWQNLLKYAELVRSLKVPFIQLLEPKAVGHYKGKDVFLDETHLSILEKFYKTLNFGPAYKDYPVIIYHGYHQRRVGCLSGGDRNLYIDSDGYVNACPFCHTKNFNIKDALANKTDIQASVKASGCQSY
ncbi:MAG: radical SAM protein [Segetibacter sp.]|nr:radical SAM protein [Segetibacter sp.]